jgi:YegS/Rv2252/BmrU family lipid kinase
LLAGIADECDLKHTAAPGDARRLAAAAVAGGADTVFAAGGDGTLNEVLNGMGDVEGGFERARLGVLPLGTINVFARELGLPMNPAAAWSALRNGNERRVDLPCVETGELESRRRTYFAQLAGAGLDARAIQLVDDSLKQRIGPFAYIVAGLQAMREKHATLTVSDGAHTAKGQLVLIGNGRFYGGSYRIFPEAELADGRLDVCVFPRVDWPTLIRCGLTLLIAARLPGNAAVRLRAGSFTLVGQSSARFEVDGELGGPLPARFSVQPGALRVLVP